MDAATVEDNEQRGEGKEFPWSQWDILPLEGQLLDRLESLTLGQGHLAPRDLDRFMNRLRRSSAGGTLRSLEIVREQPEISRSVSFEALRDCVCDLRNLQVFTIEYVDIRDPAVNIEVQTEQRLPPTVKILSVKCSVSDTLKMAIVDLFSNVQILTLSPGQDMWGAAEDRNVFSNTINNGSSTKSNSNSNINMDFVPSEAGGRHLSPSLFYPVPLPKLRKMDAMLGTLEQCTSSRLFQTWITQRKPRSLQEKGGFEIFSIRLPFYREQENQRSLMRLVKTLTQEAVMVSSLQVFNENISWVVEILTSRFCRNLQELLLPSKYFNSSRAITFAFLKEHAALQLAATVSDPWAESEEELEGVQEYEKGQEQELAQAQEQERVQEQEQEQVWSMSQEDLWTALPWSRTLTRLSLKYALDSRSDVGSLPTNLVFMRSFLRLLPRLVDFEMSDPIVDLFLFEGLGRNAAPQISLDDDASSKAESNSTPQVSYWSIEAPLLERLHICQSSQKGDPMLSASDYIDNWQEQLQFKFRFMKDLRVSRRDSTWQMKDLRVRRECTWQELLESK